MLEKEHSVECSKNILCTFYIFLLLFFFCSKTLSTSYLTANFRNYCTAKKWHSIECFKSVITKKHSYNKALFLRLFRFKFFKSWIWRKFSLVKNATSNSGTGKISLNMSNAVEMKRIGWNVMAVAIKLTRILCCATIENEKDGKLDTFVMFAPKSSITRHNLR